MSKSPFVSIEDGSETTLANLAKLPKSLQKHVSVCAVVPAIKTADLRRNALLAQGLQRLTGDVFKVQYDPGLMGDDDETQPACYFYCTPNLSAAGDELGIIYLDHRKPEPLTEQFASAIEQNIEQLQRIVDSLRGKAGAP